jgi:hypothetical protein
VWPGKGDVAVCREPVQEHVSLVPIWLGLHMQVEEIRLRLEIGSNTRPVVRSMSRRPRGFARSCREECEGRGPAAKRHNFIRGSMSSRGKP